MIFFVEIKFKYETKLTKYLLNAFLPYNASFWLPKLPVLLLA